VLFGYQVNLRAFTPLYNGTTDNGLGIYVTFSKRLWQLDTTSIRSRYMEALFMNRAFVFRARSRVLAISSATISDKRSDKRSVELSPEKCFIFRITSLKKVPGWRRCWIDSEINFILEREGWFEREFRNEAKIYEEQAFSQLKHTTLTYSFFIFPPHTSHLFSLCRYLFFI